MGLVWNAEDIQSIITALAVAGDLQEPGDHKALADVGLAFGLTSSWPGVTFVASEGYRVVIVAAQRKGPGD